MTKKKDPNLTLHEALVKAWKNRKDYKGYDRTKGSAFNSWRAIINTQKGKLIGFPISWKNYDIFMKEISGKWKRGKIVLRKDKTKPYSKDNCYWGEKGIENCNRLVKLTHNNETLTLVEWCAKYNLNYNGVRQRYFRGKNYTSEEILFGKNHKIVKKSKLQFNKSAYRRFHAYKERDKKKNLYNDLDLEFTKKLMLQPCIYCGSTENIGLDRIDNTKGHTKDNVVPCCYVCNTTRNNNFSFEEMKLIGKTIKEILICRQKNKVN